MKELVENEIIFVNNVDRETEEIEAINQKILFADKELIKKDQIKLKR